MKGPGTAEATVAVARAAGFDSRRLWLCGGAGSSAGWRQYDPDVRLVTDLRWRDALLHDDARVHGVRVDALGRQPLLEADREEHVGRLALAVRGPLLVRRLVAEVRVVPPHR